MSYDGSSAKSYIRHATEKERLDNLAFATFPEDYLPYASTSGQNRTSAPPPYLLWGDDRRRRPPKKRRNPKCAGALLCAIALVVLAILAVVAISVYLGVVTNLFRSPVVSVSGRFLASEEFSEELLNSSSSKFLEKVDVYQAKVEKAFLSSPLEPAFIAARIYSFRPGLVIFFRVYLDRRKLKQDDAESPPTELVRELVAQKLTADPESVHVEENEELLSVELPPLETVHSPLPSTTSKPSTERKDNKLPPAAGGVGQWRPIPIEDSVSPSFADRPSGGVGPVRPPEDTPRRNPAEAFGSSGGTRVSDNAPARNPPPVTANNQEGVGTVRILEEPPSRNPQLNNRGTVRLLEESSPPKSPQLIPQGGIGPASGSKESAVRNPLFTADKIEGVGSVRRLPESPLEAPQFSNHPVGVGFVRVTDANPEIAPMLPANAGEGVGSVSVIDVSPDEIPPFPIDPRAGLGTVRVLEETPPNKLLPLLKPSGGFARPNEEPPTLAPSVSLVVRNRSRSDKPRNLLSRLEKDHHDVGVGLIREIITEVDPPLPLQKESPVFVATLPDSTPKDVTKSGSEEQNITEWISDRIGSIEVETQNISTEIPSTLNDGHDPYNNAENSKLETSSQKTTGNLIMDLITSISNERELETTTKNPQTTDFKSSLENILFSQQSPFTTVINKLTEELSTESSLFRDSQDARTTVSPQNRVSDATDGNTLEEVLGNETQSSTTDDSDKDIHSSIVNYSQYLYPEPHFHSIEKERNASSEESFELHTHQGHGFHKPLNASHDNTHLKPSNIDSTTQTATTPPPTSATEKDQNESSDDFMTSPPSVPLTTESSTLVTDSPTQQPLTNVEVSDNATTVAVKEMLSSENETDNVTAEDTSQQAKFISQLQSDFLSNDIGEEQESGDEENENFNDEVLRHITTIRPQSNSSNTSVQSCPAGSVACNESGNGCGVRCDLRRDCPSNEDEKGCICADLLRAMGQSQKICDGVNDCSDKSDESNCSWCPSADYFRCPGSRTCVTLDKVCDGKDDCPGAHDERRCVSLAETSSEAETHEYRPEGYLIVRRSGQWGKLCLDSLTRLQDHEIRIRELGRAVCSTLTYRNMTSSARAIEKENIEDNYYQISTEVASNKSSSIFAPTTCKEKEVLRVQCKTLECGLRPSAITSQRRRIVGGKSADNVGSWPWAAALYREGDFQCGAALINDIWLVSAGHCFYSSRKAYWTARLGVLRRGSELLSGEEQVRKIRNIILHPQYEDVGFINDIALLKLDRPVPFSDSLRPICLPSSPAEDASLWHGRRCTVVGWGKLYEIGHTFPDSLQEVKLPVISSAECLKRSIFLPAYRITPNMFCAGYDRGGRDACLGDSGGPMACQRPADGRWILLGITSNGDGCGRPGRPGVYSQVAGFLSWIDEVIAQDDKELSGKIGLESTCSRGIRCRLGRCVPQARVCDGRRDCAEGEDEEDC